MTAPATTPPVDAPEKPEPRPRRKMTLESQNIYLQQLLGRCTMHSPAMRGQYAGEATLCLTQDDMAALEAIQQTIALFELHGADQMVRDKLSRRFRK